MDATDQASTEQATLFPGWLPKEGPIVALTPRERNLLRGMVRLCERANLPYCWASQKDHWAQNMGIGESRVRAIVLALKRKKFLVVIRQGRNNAYYFPATLKKPFTDEEIDAIKRAYTTKTKTSGRASGQASGRASGQASGRASGQASGQNAERPYRVSNKHEALNREAETATSWLARQWVFHLKRAPNRTEALEDVQAVFDELIRHGLTAERLGAEIADPNRRRTETLWDLENRLLPKNGGAYGRTTSNQPSKRGQPLRS